MCDGMWNEYECEAQFVMGILTILNILQELSVIRLYVLLLLLSLTLYILVKHIRFHNIFNFAKANFSPITEHNKLAISELIKVVIFTEDGFLTSGN